MARELSRGAEVPYILVGYRFTWVFAYAKTHYAYALCILLYISPKNVENETALGRLCLARCWQGATVGKWARGKLGCPWVQFHLSLWGVVEQFSHGDCRSDGPVALMPRAPGNYRGGGQGLLHVSGDQYFN